MSGALKAPEKQLEDAFQVFNQVSEQLVDSYGELQRKVAALSDQLAASNGERIRQLAEKERLANRLSKLLDALPAAVVVVDGADQVRQYNPAAAQLIPGLHQAAHWPTLYREVFDCDWQGEELRLRTGQIINMTRRGLDPEPGYLLLLLNITETRELQARIERQQRLTAMGEMAAQLAHQIRTPLTSALLYSAHLAREDLSPAQRARFSDRCRARLLHMERQINDMLSFSRGPQMRSEPVNLCELLAELGQTLEPLASARGLTLTVCDHVGVAETHSGNRDALLGAFANIAGNALEHCADGGRVRVELTRQKENWLLRFCDDGPGIPPALQQKIFDPFFTTRTDGTGLGLSVAQSAILAHGGRIKVESSAGAGACFSVTLPRRAASDVPVEPVVPVDRSIDPVVVRYSA